MPVGVEVVEGQKVEGRGVTRPTPPTPELWQKHLNGEYSLGAVPVTEQGTCRWATIDNDDYTVDAVEFDRRVAAAGLPLVVARSKSGGAHGFLFLREWTSAALVREKLREWAQVLGCSPDVEIFPKQNKLSDDWRINDGTTGEELFVGPEEVVQVRLAQLREERPGNRLAASQDSGNWLNLPYYGGDRSLRYAIGDGGVALSMVAFLDLVDMRSTTEEDLRNLKPVDDPTTFDDGLALPGAPPCLLSLMAEPPRGFRNELFFTATLYFKRADPKNVVARAKAWATEHLSPYPGDREINQVIKSARAKPYNYRCKSEPLLGRCDRDTCIRRRFGVAASGNARQRTDGSGDPLPLELGPLIKILTSPPIWVWDVNGHRVELVTDDLMNQRGFIKRVFEETNELLKPLRPTAWYELLTEYTLKAEIVTPPPDATARGQMWVALQRFCLGRAQGKSMDELLLGKPFTQDGRTHFQSSDFLSYLQQQGVRGVTERLLYGWLHDRGLEHHASTLNGQTVDYWSVPEFTPQDEPFAVPREETAGGGF